MTWIPRPRVSFLKSEDGAHGGIGVVPDIMPALHNVRLLTHNHVHIPESEYVEEEKNF